MKLMLPFLGGFPKDWSWGVSRKRPSLLLSGLKLGSPVEIFVNSLGNGSSPGLRSAVS